MQSTPPTSLLAIFVKRPDIAEHFKKHFDMEKFLASNEVFATEHFLKVPNENLDAILAALNYNVYYDVNALLGVPSRPVVLVHFTYMEDEYDISGCKLMLKSDFDFRYQQLVNYVNENDEVPFDLDSETVQFFSLLDLDESYSVVPLEADQLHMLNAIGLLEIGNIGPLALVGEL